jgi:hypothetical protein
MDLNQRKLTSNEWEFIEKPLEPSEIKIINLIKEGFIKTDIKKNDTLCLIDYIKIENNKDREKFIYVRYLQDNFIKILKYSKSKSFTYEILDLFKSKINKADQIRIKNTDKQIDNMKKNIIEFIILDLLKQSIKCKEKNNINWKLGIFSIKTILNYKLNNFNSILYNLILNICVELEKEINIKDLIYRGVDLIEKNSNLLKYKDNELFDHQKKLFNLFNNESGNKLVLYQAATGTGKTLSPIGLVNKYKIIFLCAARHVGLSLARAAINAGIKVAFAFGCEDADSIRLHYNAVKECTRDKYNGKIKKVDNSQGQLVELIICDLKSYIPAMYYMLAFNHKNDIITYWDEPTITLDYDDHPCHEIINRNWSENIIPNIILCSATLPSQNEIADTIENYKEKFEGEIYSIKSNNYNKSISLINKEGNLTSLHSLYDDYRELYKAGTYCLNNKNLLRYLDLSECINLIGIINEDFENEINDSLKIEFNFKNLDDISMISIKDYYLKLITNIDPGIWPDISNQLKVNNRFKSNILITTEDAHTLTDGPTIFLADNINKIGKFCIQRANIPLSIIKDIYLSIKFNDDINEKILNLSKNLEDLLAKDIEHNNDNKMSNINRGSSEEKKIRNDINNLSKQIKNIKLPMQYIPNSSEHLLKFLGSNSKNAFTSNINEEEIKKIMMISNIDDFWKLLLLMGIGVFQLDNNLEYIEVMKELAYKQKLYLIIATGDFIYGTNYQFCHCYLSGDLNNISQEKVIQAIGRVGRNKLQFDYTIRFRDNKLINKLFEKEVNKPEVKNINILFS